MIRYRLLAALFLLFLFSPACMAAEEPVLNEGNNGSTIIITEGQSLKLNLESNPSTGFSWEHFPDLKTGLLEETEHGYLPDLQLPGTGGKEFWTFKAINSGDFTLSLAYMRPWENRMPSKTFSVNIKITPEIKVLLDGKTLVFDVPPLEEKDTLLAPLRTVAEALGAKVNWLPDTLKVRVEKGDRIVEFEVGSDTALINGSAVKLAAPAQMFGDRVLVPLRFIGDTFDCRTDWDETGRTAGLTSKGNK